jgi:hypothetical protein
MPYRISAERFKEIEPILSRLPDLELNMTIKVNHPDPIQLRRIRSTIYEWLSATSTKSSFRIKQITPNELLVIRIGFDATQITVTESRLPGHLDKIMQALIELDDPLIALEMIKNKQELPPKDIELLEKEIRRVFE